MAKKSSDKLKVQKALSPAVCSTTTTKCQVTIVPSHRYTLQWNFGKSQCSFDTIDDVKEFIRDNLKMAESHMSSNVELTHGGREASDCKPKP